MTGSIENKQENLLTSTVPQEQTSATGSVTSLYPNAEIGVIDSDAGSTSLGGLLNIPLPQTNPQIPADDLSLTSTFKGMKIIIYFPIVLTQFYYVALYIIKIF